MTFLFVLEVVTGQGCGGWAGSGPAGEVTLMVLWLVFIMVLLGKLPPNLQQLFYDATTVCGVRSRESTVGNLVSASLCLYLSWRALRLQGTKSPKPGLLVSGPWAGLTGELVSSCDFYLIQDFLTARNTLGTSGRGVV